MSDWLNALVLFVWFWTIHLTGLPQDQVFIRTGPDWVTYGNRVPCGKDAAPGTQCYGVVARLAAP